MISIRHGEDPANSGLEIAFLFILMTRNTLKSFLIHQPVWIKATLIISLVKVLDLDWSHWNVCGDAKTFDIFREHFSFIDWLFFFFRSKADEWRFHRKNLNPSFHYNVVKSFYPTFNKKLKIFIKRLRTYVGKPFRLQHYIESCAMDMICGKYLRKFIENIKC